MSNAIWKYSNPKTAQEKAYRFFGKNAILYQSTKKNKKYMMKLLRKRPPLFTLVKFPTKTLLNITTRGENAIT